MTLNRSQRTTYLSRGRVPLKILSNGFYWPIDTKDLIFIIPPEGPFFYVITTSFHTITRLITLLGGPECVPAASSSVRKDKKARTYSLTLPRMFLTHSPHLILAKHRKRKHRKQWDEEEWIRYFTFVGRSKAGLRVYLQAQKLRRIPMKIARAKYMEIIEKAGLLPAPIETIKTVIEPTS